MSDRDDHYMLRAISLARQAEGMTSPNPLVGCVLVGADGVVGEGWHKGPGSFHAEAMALAQAGARARGATAFVTLEPCNHLGRTPPCAQALIDAGVAKVVYGAKDPNPLASGGGATLDAAGVETQLISGPSREAAAALIRPWAFAMAHDRPYVFAKWASTLDGFVATRKGSSKWITGAPARARGHDLRQMTDAIMVGVETVVRDDPGLDARPSSRVSAASMKIVLDTHLRCPPDAKLFSVPGPVLIACGKEASADRELSLLDSGAEVMRVPSMQRGVCIKTVLTHLRRRDIFSVMIEGGGAVLGSVFDAGLVDEVWAFLAPSIMGGGKKAVAGTGPADVADLARLSDVQIEQLGRDVLVRGQILQGDA